MKSDNVLFLAAAVLALAVLVFLFSLSSFLGWPAVEKERVYASVNVSDRIGFDVNGTALTFGSILPGGSSSRSVVFQNTYDFPLEGRVVVEGDIAEVLNVRERWRVPVDGETEIPLSVYAGDGTQRGFYDGFVVFRLVRVSS